jgi:hypothetical protein
MLPGHVPALFLMRFGGKVRGRRVFYMLNRIT